MQCKNVICPRVSPYLHLIDAADDLVRVQDQPERQVRIDPALAIEDLDLMLEALELEVSVAQRTGIERLAGPFQITEQDVPVRRSAFPGKLMLSFFAQTVR